MHACMRACAICISGICGTLLRRSGSSHLNLFSEVNPNSCICETSPATSVCGPQVGIVSSMTGELTDWDKTVRVLPLTRDYRSIYRSPAGPDQTGHYQTGHCSVLSDQECPLKKKWQP
eukprot:1156056-Pelagomonas_calceolata.AAC.15